MTNKRVGKGMTVGGPDLTSHRDAFIHSGIHYLLSPLHIFPYLVA